MLADLLAAFPGSRLRGEAGGLIGPVCVQGTFHQLRVRFDPVVELFVALPALDGFELEVHLGDRWIGDTRLGDPTIADAYFIRTNDPGLARTWLDAPARAVLRAVPLRLEAHDRAEIARLAPRGVAHARGEPRGRALPLSWSNRGHRDTLDAWSCRARASSSSLWR